MRVRTRRTFTLGDCVVVAPIQKGCKVERRGVVPEMRWSGLSGVEENLSQGGVCQKIDSNY